MPVKTHKNPTKKIPKHYAKVYWPYLPLIVIVLAGLWLGHPSVERSQRGTVLYATNVSNTGLLATTNQLRRQHGQKPLIADARLTAAATTKAQDMANHNYWSSVGPNGQTTQSLISQTGYSFAKATENLAYGFDDSSQAVKGWLNNPATRAAVLSAEYRQIGFGVAKSKDYLNKGPETIVVAMYAAPASTSQTIVNAAASRQLADQLDTTASTASISKVQTLTDGRAPWIGGALVIIAGAGLIYLIIKHAVGIRRHLRKGERFVIKHPIFDLTIIAFAALCALLCQSVGVIGV